MKQKTYSDEEILSAVLTSRTQKEAAQKLGCSRQTLNYRMQSKTLKKRLSEYRKECLDIISRTLLSSAERASMALDILLESENEFVVYNAAAKILALVQDYVATQEIQSRLEELEEKTNDNI